MKILKFTGAFIALAFAGSAFGAAITITPADCDGVAPDMTCWTSDDPSNPSDADINAWVGTTGLVTQYKAEVGDEEDDPATPEDDTLTTESGAFADDYSTLFMNAALDPQDAWITWAESDSIDCSEGCFLVVKDGRHEPSTYVFDISHWNGTSAIHAEGFWPGRGAISHVAILAGGATRVPEPGTLALLGFGLFGMGLLGRRRTT